MKIKNLNPFCKVIWNSPAMLPAAKFHIRISPVFCIFGLFLLLAAVPLFAAGPTITAKAVFVPDDSMMDAVRRTCSGEDNFMSCYVRLFKNAGAPDDAVDFIKLTDEPGYLRKLKKVGPVDIAFVDFPFRANENHGIFLVNGAPEIINVDDLSEIAGAMLEDDPGYKVLKRKYPDIALFMGDRFSDSSISAERLKTGKLKFTVAYRLTTGCRACQDAGVVSIAFYFDRKGTFMGRKLIDIRPAKN